MKTTAVVQRIAGMGEKEGRYPYLRHQQCFPNCTLPNSAAANKEFFKYFDRLAKPIFYWLPSSYKY